MHEKMLTALKIRFKITRVLTEFFIINDFLSRRRFWREREGILVSFFKSKTNRLSCQIHEIEYLLKNCPEAFEEPKRKALERIYIFLETLCSISFVALFVIPFLLVYVSYNRKRLLLLVILVSGWLLMGLTLFLSEKGILKITALIREMDFKVMGEKSEE